MALVDLFKKDNQVTITTPEPELETGWIWVEGYKGTDKDMRCKGYQYSLNTEFEHTGDIKLCESGFHFCVTLQQTHLYYPIKNNNRFFKVKALVKAEEYEHAKYINTNPMLYFASAALPYYSDKLVAKKIIFLEEIDNNTLFENTLDLSIEYWDLARRIGVDEAKQTAVLDTLTNLGYSTGVSTLIIKRGTNTIETAKILASDPSISMEMKIALIFTLT